MHILPGPTSLLWNRSSIQTTIPQPHANIPNKSPKIHICTYVMHTTLLKPVCSLLPLVDNDNMFQPPLYAESSGEKVI